LRGRRKYFSAAHSCFAKKPGVSIHGHPLGACAEPL
jgi:hypothetical protein